MSSDSWSHQLYNFTVYLCLLTELTQNPPEGIVAGTCIVIVIVIVNYCWSRDSPLSVTCPGPKSEENFFEWEALIT